MNTTLQTLPGEIRNQIYEELLEEDIFFTFHQTGSRKWIQLAKPNLQLVNKQLGREFRGYILKAIHNSRWKFRDAGLFSTILALAPALILAEIKTLHLDFTNIEYHYLWYGTGPRPHFLAFSRLSNLKNLAINFQGDPPNPIPGNALTTWAFRHFEANYLIMHTFPWSTMLNTLTIVGEISENVKAWMRREWYRRRMMTVRQ